MVLWPLFKYADDSTIISSVDNKCNSFVSLVERFLTWFKEKKMSYIPCECTKQIVRKKISSMQYAADFLPYNLQTDCYSSQFDPIYDSPIK